LPSLPQTKLWTANIVWIPSRCNSHLVNVILYNVAEVKQLPDPRMMHLPATYMLLLRQSCLSLGNVVLYIAVRGKATARPPRDALAREKQG